MVAGAPRPEQRVAAVIGSVIGLYSGLITADDECVAGSFSGEQRDVPVVAGGV